MRNLVIATFATSMIIAAPAFAQTAGNLLGNNGSQSSSSSSTNQQTGSRGTNSGVSSERRDTTIGGISANPQVSYYNDKGQARASSASDNGGGNGSSQNASQSSNYNSNGGALALPVAVGSSTLGGGSNRAHRNTQTTGSRSNATTQHSNSSH